MTITYHLKRHVEIVHFKIKRFTCEVCDYKTTENAYLTRHVESVHCNIKRFACEHCHCKAAFKHMRQIHMKKIHVNVRNNSEDTKRKMEKCQLREYETASEESLTEHLMSIHVKK